MLKEKLKNTASQDELVDVSNQTGYNFLSEHVDEAIDELKQKSGFLGMLAEAAVEVSNPYSDNYPATGAQPYSGKLNSKT